MSFSYNSSFAGTGYVTPFPKALDGMNVFLSPFDDMVWVVLLLSCVTITFVIGLSRIKTVENFMSDVTQDLFNVTCILLRQVNGESLRMFNNRACVAVPILTVWFLGGCYVIMDNLYTGSVFSFLSAVKAPRLPSSLVDLADSEIPIMTHSWYLDETDRPIRKIPILNDYLVPQYVNLFKDSPEMMNMFRQLLKKLIFIHQDVDEYMSQSGISKLLRNSRQAMSGVSPNKVIDPEKTFAIMDSDQIVRMNGKLLQSTEKRLILYGKEYTPFNKVFVEVLKRNYLLPIFLKRLGQLLSNGMVDRWRKLEELYVPLYAHYAKNHTDYRKHFAVVMSNGREQITFHEANSISMGSVKEVFVLCGIFLSVSFVSILVECRRSFVYFMEFSLWACIHVLNGLITSLQKCRCRPSRRHKVVKICVKTINSD
ncbi:Glutamate receptor 3.7 [Folsomia candida]|uniref:Glutamate receptor 3.7 n=1 Tax=Folsomia candida TaxID=158441 RepID=A0A226DS96_FOLCA|nr:Glutamate receptor 3.7 [Folsomia candida]